MSVEKSNAKREVGSVKWEAGSGKREVESMKWKA